MRPGGTDTASPQSARLPCAFWNHASTRTFRAQSGSTDIFIYPPHDVLSADILLTNFHLPKSTLLMLVCAFAGYEHTMNAYRIAVRERMRFFSYGDCMLILK